MEIAFHKELGCEGTRGKKDRLRGGCCFVFKMEATCNVFISRDKRDVGKGDAETIGMRGVHYFAKSQNKVSVNSECNGK